MRPRIPAAPKKARVKQVLPAPSSPRRWMRPPGAVAGRPGCRPHSMGASWAASPAVASSSGKSMAIVFNFGVFSFMAVCYSVAPSISHKGMVAADIKVPIDIVPATRRPSPPILAAST